MLMAVLLKRAREIKLFLAAIAFSIIGTQLHSCEVHTKESLATANFVDLDSDENLEIRFSIPKPNTIRLTALIMEDLNLPYHQVKSTIEFQLKNEEKIVLKGSRSPSVKSGGGRWKNISSSYWNYGLFELGAAGEYTMKVTPNPEIKRLKTYHLRIHTDASDAVMSFFQNMSLLILLISFLFKEYRAFYAEIRHGFKFVYFFFVVYLILMNIIL